MSTDLTRHRSYARKALRQQMAGQSNEAADTVQAMINELGPHSAVFAAQAWIDSAARAAGVLQGSDAGPVRVLWADESNTISTAAGVSPQIRWAGQLFSARVAMDEPMYIALWNSLPWSNNPGSYLLALLNCAALTARGGVRRQSALKAKAGSS